MDPVNWHGKEIGAPPTREGQGWRHKENMNIMIISTPKTSELENKPETYLDSDVKSINEIMDRIPKAGTPLSIQEAADLLCEVDRAILSIRQIAYQVVHSGLDLEESRENVILTVGSVEGILDRLLTKSEECLISSGDTYNQGYHDALMDVLKELRNCK